MATNDPAEFDGLLREVMAVLRRAYDLGRTDALREAAAMLAAAAPPASVPDQGHGAAALILRRKGHARRGRPDTLTEDRKAAAAALLAEGRLSRRRVAQEVGVSPARLYRWLKENGKAS